MQYQIFHIQSVCCQAQRTNWHKWKARRFIHSNSFTLLTNCSAKSWIRERKQRSDEQLQKYLHYAKLWKFRFTFSIVDISLSPSLSNSHAFLYIFPFVFKCIFWRLKMERKVHAFGSHLFCNFQSGVSSEISSNISFSSSSIFNNNNQNSDMR